MTYEVWPNGHDPKTGMTIVNASGHADAAEQYAERADSESAEYEIVSGKPEIVSVRAINEDEIKVFTVGGEVVHKYSAELFGDSK